MRIYNFEKKHGVLIRREQCTAEKPEAVHLHKFVELVYTASGEGTHYIGGRAYPVRRGDLLFINYGETHAIESADKMTFCNLLVKPEFLCENLIDGGSVDDVFCLFFSDGSTDLRENGRRCVHLSGVLRAETEQLIERMLEESNSERIGRHFVLNGYMRLIFAILIRALQKESPPARKHLSQKALSAYLEANFTAGVTLATVAADLGYHPAYLGRAFRTLYGMGFKECLRARRMDYAATLLEGSDTPVSEVIAACGYTNRTQFYRDFATHHGTTPALYRISHREHTLKMG